MKKLLALLLMLVLLLTLTGCAATEEPLVKKDDIIKRVALEQVKGPEEAGTYNVSFYCPVTDSKQFQTAFFGDRPSELRETGYGYEVNSTTGEKAYLRTYPLTRGMENGKWIGSLQTDCAAVMYHKGNGYEYMQAFRYCTKNMQGALKSALRSKSADRLVLQEAEKDSTRILRELGMDSFQMRFSGGYTPSDFSRFAALAYKKYPNEDLPKDTVYIVEYLIAPDRKPADGYLTDENYAFFLYDGSGLIGAHVSFERVYECTGEVYVPCSAETAYQAAVADWHEPGAILVEASFYVKLEHKESETEGSAYIGKGNGYWRFTFLYPETNETIIRFQLSQLGEYRDEVTGYYGEKNIYVDARTGAKMTGYLWEGGSSFAKNYIHQYNNWSKPVT